jgi:hypothetical protein
MKNETIKNKVAVTKELLGQVKQTIENNPNLGKKSVKMPKIIG